MNDTDAEMNKQTSLQLKNQAVQGKKPYNFAFKFNKKYEIFLNIRKRSISWI